MRGREVGKGEESREESMRRNKKEYKREKDTLRGSVTVKQKKNEE